MIKRAQEWFHQKDPREQRLLLALLVCGVSILFWFGLYQPLKQATDTMQSRYAKVQRDLQWLQKQVSAAALLPEKRPSGSLENQVKSSLHMLDCIGRRSQDGRFYELAGGATGRLRSADCGT